MGEKKALKVGKLKFLKSGKRNGKEFTPEKRLIKGRGHPGVLKRERPRGERRKENPKIKWPPN